MFNSRYGSTNIGLYRRLEKHDYKLNKAKLDLEFGLTTPYLNSYTLNYMTLTLGKLKHMRPVSLNC